MTQIKNCDRCGRRPTLRAQQTYAFSEYRVECKCGLMTKWISHEPKEAREIWNRRSAPSLEGLPAAVDEEIENAKCAAAPQWMAEAGKANLRHFVANAVKIWLESRNKEGRDE